MIETLHPRKDAWTSQFARFEKELGDRKRSAVHRLRKLALARFEELGFPTVHDEEWRFTNVAPIAQAEFYRLLRYDRNGLAQESIGRFNFADCIPLVFVDGHFAPDITRDLLALSAPRKLPAGLVVTSLAAALESYPDPIEKHLARHARHENNAFTALNTAFLCDGAFVQVPRGMVLEEPIHLLFVSSGRDQPILSQPRNLIVVEPHAQATLVESYVGLREGPSFTNAVTEIVAAEHARVDHYRVQQESLEAFHVGTLQVHQDRGSWFSSHAITLGGALVRNEIGAVLDAEGCECILNGFYQASGEQHIDNQTTIDHARPHCASHELYKGILDGRARGVFSGKIHVHPQAQKTDAKQTNQTLLLSDDATINTKPQLEIYADDVKCTHGATVGQLNAESVFYLRSRGLGLAEARSLLVFAFANDIIGRIKVEPIRARLEEAILRSQHLPDQPGLEEAP